MNQTVSWLAGQAADRYNQIYNVRPVGLTLALQDGAKLAPNDLISSTFLDNEEVCTCLLCEFILVEDLQFDFQVT